MENYLEEIKIKLKKNIKLEEIDVVDNSHLHSKHKFFFRFALKKKNEFKKKLNSKKN